MMCGRLSHAECDEFTGYLRNCTDGQLYGVLAKEVESEHRQEIKLTIAELKRRQLDVPVGSRWRE